MIKLPNSFPEWFRIRNWLRRFWDMVPFLGRLDYSNGTAWKRASLETIISVALSSVPLWVAVSVLCLSDMEPTYRSATTYVVRHGELLLLAGSAVSPLIYMVSVAYRKPHKPGWITTFPHGAYYLLGAICIIILSATYIAVRTASAHGNDSAASFTPHNLEAISWKLYVFSLLLFFTASVHRNTVEEEDPLDVNKRAEDDFDKQWVSRND